MLPLGKPLPDAVCGPCVLILPDSGASDEARLFSCFSGRPWRSENNGRSQAAPDGNQKERQDDHFPAIFQHAERTSDSGPAGEAGDRVEDDGAEAERAEPHEQRARESAVLGVASIPAHGHRDSAKKAEAREEDQLANLVRAKRPCVRQAGHGGEMDARALVDGQGVVQEHDRQQDGPHEGRYGSPANRQRGEHHDGQGGLHVLKDLAEPCLVRDQEADIGQDTVPLQDISPDQNRIAQEEPVERRATWSGQWSNSTGLGMHPGRAIRTTEQPVRFRVAGNEALRVVPV